MKIIFKYIIRPLIILLFVTVSFNAMAQAPPPPPGGGTGNDNNPGNSLNGAPIGNELIIFLLLGAAYGGKKVYDFKKKEIAKE